MRGERVTPKPPDDVRVTMTADEAVRLKALIQTWDGRDRRDRLNSFPPLVPGNLICDVCHAIDEALK